MMQSNFLREVKSQKPFFFHLEDHIYMAFFQREAILLNLKKNNYAIFHEDLSNALDILLEHPFCLNGQLYEPFSSLTLPIQKEGFKEFLSTLIERGIIKPQPYEYPYEFQIEKRDSSSGIYNPSWRLSEGKRFGNSDGSLVRESFLVLLKVHFYAKKRKFYGLISYLKKQKKIYETILSYPSSDQIESLIISLNKACIVYIKETKCLEWSIALVLMALKRGWRFNLAVGVQNYPFVAHAWVEYEGKPISDTSDFPKNLSVILREPFRVKRRREI